MTEIRHPRSYAMSINASILFRHAMANGTERKASVRVSDKSSGLSATVALNGIPSDFTPAAFADSVETAGCKFSVRSKSGGLTGGANLTGAAARRQLLAVLNGDCSQLTAALTASDPNTIPGTARDVTAVDGQTAGQLPAAALAD